MNLQTRTDHLIRTMQERGLSIDTTGAVQVFALAMLNSVSDQTGVRYCPDLSFGHVHRRAEYPRLCPTCRDASREDR